ncbi:MAG: hypothetical protein ACRENO_07715 [Thermodesulfobacteriota bacterium]
MKKVLKDACRNKKFVIIFLCLVSCGSNDVDKFENTESKYKKEVIENKTKIATPRLKPSIEKKEEITILDDIDKLNKSQKIELIKEITGKKSWLVPKFETRWDLIEELNDPTIALYWAFYEFEPLTEQMIYVLEETFDLSKVNEEKFRIASLLYRYKNEIGKKYLLDQLNEELNKDAALILLNNKEEEAIDGAINYIKRGNYDPEVMLALGSMKDQKVGSFFNQLLSENFSKKRIRFDSMEALRLGKYSLETQNKNQLVELFESSNSEGVKIEAASTLLLDSNLSDSVYSDFIKEKINDWDALKYKTDQAELIRSLGKNDYLGGETFLTKLAKDYIETDIEFDTNFHIPLFETLARSGKVENVKLVADALRKRRKIHKLSDPKKTDYRLVEMIYDSDSPNAEDLIQEIMGEEYLYSFLTIKELKELPGKYQPSYTQGFTGDYFHYDRYFRK